MASSTFKQSEMPEHAQPFRQMEEGFMKNVHAKNKQEVVMLLNDAMADFQNKGVSKTAIEAELSKSSKWKNVRVSFMEDALKAGIIYSVKLEADSATKIFTLRVGNDFTELSLEKDGKFVEILREEKGTIRHEKFA